MAKRGPPRSYGRGRRGTGRPHRAASLCRSERGSRGLREPSRALKPHEHPQRPVGRAAPPQLCS
eukprot:1019020-Pyramimonas_sp.AAC.1